MAVYFSRFCEIMVCIQDDVVMLALYFVRPETI